jgi:hypothetical protein
MNGLSVGPFIAYPCELIEVTRILNYFLEVKRTLYGKDKL